MDVCRGKTTGDSGRKRSGIVSSKRLVDKLHEAIGVAVVVIEPLKENQEATGSLVFHGRALVVSSLKIELVQKRSNVFHGDNRRQGKATPNLNPVAHQGERGVVEQWRQEL